METISRERLNCPFDLWKMTCALHGGERLVLLKDKFMQEIERDPGFRLDDIHDLTKDQIRERTMAKFANMVHYVTTERLDIFTKRMELIGIADPAFWTRFGVHYGLFLGAIRSGATSNQFSYWLEKGVLGLNGITGCFAMTELAHGSNVAGLETTATFDEQTDEFVIHTPSVSATKWWIGGAAQTATHCSAFARLIVNGKDHGTKTFIVPLRDPRNFALLPGVNIGDIGKKMGRDGIDNGYIQFTNVRIPRAYMLMKHTQVTRDGKVFEPPLAQLTYGALLQGRTAMVADGANVAKKALTIAIRYGAVRRQFKTGDNPFETQLLDYPIHQRRLMPLLAQAIAMGFTALRMTEMYENLSEELEAFDSSSDKEQTDRVLETLKETHASSAGLKAFSTWQCLETIDKCRQALGGHGYSAYAGLASMYSDQAVQCTWEGDNTILSLQAGRSLISAHEDAQKGKKLASGTSYLNDQAILAARCHSDAAVIDLSTMDSAWATIAANVVKKAADVYHEKLNAGAGKDVAMERCSHERFCAAKIHTIGYIFRQFCGTLASYKDEESGTFKTLKSVCELYGAFQIEENSAYFLKYGFYTPKQIDLISEGVTRLCAEIRTCAVSLVDAFRFSDHIINSPLGRYDGNVYEAYFNAVRAANPLPPVHPYFERLIKPILTREALEFGDAGEIGIDEEIESIQQERSEGSDELDDQSISLTEDQKKETEGISEWEKKR
ncbi:acyl-coenzyme a oxidase 1 [Phakopsora pachyrhizi]|uniref:Acyl-coenzyme A oxidase n=1 Tax=Phakopsora pachyrhizi TaxID=170000 RepID=A0AAV0AZ50_PHAPC|nr:acyl-coenzyme a oxidase 1 [Phakopsora pachyrhizi]CAH7689902.1 acyl-coenzyme a oxidase 1 [Phakopsora pachyrhizi]